MDNLYWDLTNLHTYNEEMDSLLLNITDGKPMKIDLHKHSCMKRRYPKFEVGKNYYIDCAESLMGASNYKLCTITGIRSGVIFYTIEWNPTEHHMEEFCLTHYFSEPDVLVVNVDPRFIDVQSISEKMKVIYVTTQPE